MRLLIALVVLLAILVIILTVKVALLRKGFDEMTESIEDQVRGNTGIPAHLTTSDPHARKACNTLNKELKALREERLRYERDGKAVSSSVTALSHDLRTPLTAVNAYLELLETETDEDKRREYLDRIRSRTESLNALTDDLYKYQTSSIEQRTSGDEDDLGPSSVALNRFLEECLLSFYASFGKAGIEPEVDIPAKPVNILIEPGDLNRILENVISNAVKYAKGSLKVKLYDDGRVEFKNPAGGITPVDAAKLTDKFFTVRSGTGSGGLGLYIARDLIEKSGGSIDISVKDEMLSIVLQFILADQPS